jgi:AcrR family transcriptional regulator
MQRFMASVKSGTRRYNSSGRKAQARHVQNHVLDVAQRRFLDTGYGQTTVAAVAAEAGVSVETIYKNFGGKPGLVRAIYERELKGPGPISAYARSDQMRAQESDPTTIMRRWGEITSEVASHLTPIRLLIRAAAVHDTDVAALLRDLDDERLQRMRHHATFLAGRNYLRAEVTIDLATDILYTCSSVEIYEVLVLQRDWPLESFATFISNFMVSSLIGS